MELLLKKAEFFEQLTLKLAQLSSAQPNVSTVEPNMSVDPRINNQSAVQQINKPIEQKQFQYVPKEIQQKLNEILRPMIEKGTVFAPILKIDGILGKDTKAALSVFKNKFAPNVNSYKELFDAINKAYVPIALENSAKQKEENTNKSFVPPGAST